MSDQQPPPGYRGGNHPYRRQGPPPGQPGPYGQRPPNQPPNQPPRGRQPGPYAQQPPGQSGGRPPQARPYGQQPPSRQPQQGQPPAQYGQRPQQGQQPAQYGQGPQQGQHQSPLSEQLSRTEQRFSGGTDNRLLLLLGGAGLLVVVLIVAVFVVVGGRGGGGSTAEEALDTFVSAVNDADCDGIKEVTTTTFHEDTNIDEECTNGAFADGVAKGAEDVAFEASEVKEDGDTATGEITVSGGSGSSDGMVIKVRLTKQDDDWLVDTFDGMA